MPTLETLSAINPATPEPFYVQIKESIIDYIHQNELQPKDLLPSERELTTYFQVSRLTVRKAIDQLIQEGRVFRRPGKGTFVSLPKLQQPLLVLRSFSEAVLQEGHTPGTQLLEFEVQEGKFRVNQKLQIHAGALVLKVRRLRFVDNLPFSLSTSYLPAELTKPIKASDLQTFSLYDVLRDKCGIHLTKTHASVDVTSALKHEAALLKIGVGSPMFHMRGTVEDGSGQMAEYFSVLYRGDRLRFIAESN
jgi:GntR family transcriptional regulator